MKLKASTMWIFTVVLSVFLESSCAQNKLNVHWGPQSMMYLKGKYGRRFASEDDGGFVKVLQSWHALLRGIQRLQLMDVNKPSRIVSSEKVVIHYPKLR